MKLSPHLPLIFFVLPVINVWSVDRLDNLEEWSIYRGDSRGTQFAELAQINAANVNRLKPVWEYHTGDAGKRTSSYANPIMVDGIIYTSTPSLNCAAIDVRTGEEVWFFDSSKHNSGGKLITGRNRGVVYWEGDRAQARIFVFVRDRVYAVDAKTGELITSFGEDGHIDLRKNLGIDPGEASIEVTTPGIIYNDILIVGSRVPEGYNSTPGHIRAYNAITGEFVWIFHTIPKPGEYGYDTWEFVDEEKYGGANPWGGFTLDPDRGWVFCATGSPNSDFYGGFRKGQNLFGNCVLALDALTGKRIWHYQTVHHDLWDMDNPSAPVLVAFSKDGKEKDAVVQFTKMGFTFVLDRETGEPLFPTPEMPVPPSTVPGEEAWPTQPIPLKPPPLGRTMITDSELSRISPEAYEHVREIFNRYNKSPIYTPPSLRGELQAPGFLGGTQWHGGSFDPHIDVIYVNSHEGPGIVKLRESLEPVGNGEVSQIEKGAFLYQNNCIACHGANREGIPPVYPSLVDSTLSEDEAKEIIREGKGLMTGYPQFSDQDLNALYNYIKTPADANVEVDPKQGVLRYHFAGFTRLRGPDGEPGIRPPWGTLNAIDLSSGEILWRVPLGEYPELVSKGIRNTGAMNYGGVVATTGGVIFVGATPDEKIRAFEKHNGNLLWEYKLPAAAYSTPSTFMFDGKQYLIVSAFGGGKNGTPSGDSIIAFALDEKEPAHPQHHPRPEDEGWISLFEGKSLDGWVHLNGSHTYNVEDGVIVGRTVPSSANSFLCTKREFSDFELEAEVWIDDVTNSGIQFRSRTRETTIGSRWSETAGRVYGPQMEIRRKLRPGSPTTGKFYGEALGIGWLNVDEEHDHDFYEPEGWNKIRIVAEGPRMRSWVNGQKVDDVTREDVYETNPSGFIGLQVHGIRDQGPFLMKFRNIRIREF